MTYQQFHDLITRQPDGVILLEGRREIPADIAMQATKIAAQLARQFPKLKFRSGNAQGSDDAFSHGVASVDPSRLQIIAPTSKHREKFRISGASYDSPKSLTPTQEQQLADQTVSASPHNRSLINNRNKTGPIAPKAAYLIRDTMKVVGHSADFPPPIFALFYVNPTDRQAGGTGHTIRVCQLLQVQYAFQDSWIPWLVA